MSTAERIRLPDDCTIGYIVEALLGVPLVRCGLFHSHLENLQQVPASELHEQVRVQATWAWRRASGEEGGRKWGGGGGGGWGCGGATKGPAVGCHHPGTQISPAAVLWSVRPASVFSRTPTLSLSGLPCIRKHSLAVAGETAAAAEAPLGFTPGAAEQGMQRGPGFSARGGQKARLSPRAELHTCPPWAEPG